MDEHLAISQTRLLRGTALSKRAQPGSVNKNSAETAIQANPNLWEYPRQHEEFSPMHVKYFVRLLTGFATFKP